MANEAVPMAGGHESGTEIINNNNNNNNNNDNNDSKPKIELIELSEEIIIVDGIGGGEGADSGGLRPIDVENWVKHGTTSPRRKASDERKPFSFANSGDSVKLIGVYYDGDDPAMEGSDAASSSVTTPSSGLGAANAAATTPLDDSFEGLRRRKSFGTSTTTTASSSRRESHPLQQMVMNQQRVIADHGFEAAAAVADADAMDDEANRTVCFAADALAAAVTESSDSAKESSPPPNNGDELFPSSLTQRRRGRPLKVEIEQDRKRKQLPLSDRLSTKVRTRRVCSPGERDFRIWKKKQERERKEAEEARKREEEEAAAAAAAEEEGEDAAGGSPDYYVSGGVRSRLNRGSRVDSSAEALWEDSATEPAIHQSVFGRGRGGGGGAVSAQYTASGGFAHIAGLFVARKRQLTGAQSLTTPEIKLEAPQDDDDDAADTDAVDPEIDDIPQEDPFECLRPDFEVLPGVTTIQAPNPSSTTTTMTTMMTMTTTTTTSQHNAPLLRWTVQRTTTEALSNRDATTKQHSVSNMNAVFVVGIIVGISGSIMLQFLLLIFAFLTRS